ncbi:TPA: hypothetical protein ACSTL5_005000 [Serratia fonticola]
MTISTLTTKDIQLIYESAVHDEATKSDESGFVLDCVLDDAGGTGAVIRKLIDMVRARDADLLAVREAQSLRGIRVGNLPTMNQDEYPGLPDWWVQLRIGTDGDEVLARIYGSTPHEAMMRARAIAAPPAPDQLTSVITAMIDNPRVVEFYSSAWEFNDDSGHKWL